MKDLNYCLKTSKDGDAQQEVNSEKHVINRSESSKNGSTGEPYIIPKQNSNGLKESQFNETGIALQLSPPVLTSAPPILKVIQLNESAIEEGESDSLTNNFVKNAAGEQPPETVSVLRTTTITTENSGPNYSEQVAHDAAENIPIPTTIGDYQIISKLGQGGMGTVYRARKEGTDFDVALKVMHASLCNEKSNRHRLKKEAEAAALLTHTNLVGIFESNDNGVDCAYLSMEYLDGQTLARLLEQKGPIDLSTFEQIFSQVCQGIFHAHAKGVIHRDLKPSNIIITGSGTVKIVDFGIARVLDSTNPTETKLTETHTVIGSPAYMSPEQCLGERLDERSDIYSLGALMYESLCGRPLFEGNNAIQIIAKHLNSPPVTLCKINAEIPRSVGEIVMRCLEKDPSTRFQTMGEVILALKHAFRSPDKPLPGKYRRISSKGPQDALWLGSIVSLASVTMVVLGVITFLNGLGAPYRQDEESLSATPVITAQSAVGKKLSDIREWMTELKQTAPTNKEQIGRLRKSIGSGYYQLAFPDPDSYTKDMDKERQDYLLSSAAYLKQAEAPLSQTSHSINALDEAYDQLSSAYRNLGNHQLWYKYALLRSKLIVKSNEVAADTKVQAQTELGQALQALGREDEANIAYRKAIELDKAKYGAACGMFASIPYESLIDSLEQRCKFAEAITIVNEKIAREAAAKGPRYFALRYAFERKAGLLEKMGKEKESRQVLNQIKTLERPPSP